jgi:hypothetical protein
MQFAPVWQVRADPAADDAEIVADRLPSTRPVEWFAVHGSDKGHCGW